MRYLPIYATTFVFSIGGGLVFVFIEDIQRLNGLTDWGVGLIAGIGFIAALICQIVLAPLADRGYVFALGLAATVCAVVGLVGFGFSSSLGFFVVTRALTGIGFGTFGIAARKALIGLDVAGGGAKLGTLLSTMVAGFILGPLVGAVFAPLGFAAPFVIVAVAAALVSVPALAIIARADVATERIRYRDVGELLARPRVQAAMLCQLVVYGYIGIFDATIDRFLTNLGASTGQTALIITCVGAPMLVFPRIAGNIAERLGGTKVIVPALAGLIPVMFGYGISTSLLAATIVGFLHGSFESFVTVSGQVLVLEAAGASRAAVATSLAEIVGLSVAALAAVFAPIIYGNQGARSLYFTAGFVGVGIGVLVWWRVANALDDAPGLTAEPASP